MSALDLVALVVLVAAPRDLDSATLRITRSQIVKTGMSTCQIERMLLIGQLANPVWIIAMDEVLGDIDLMHE